MHLDLKMANFNVASFTMMMPTGVTKTVSFSDPFFQNYTMMANHLSISGVKVHVSVAGIDQESSFSTSIFISKNADYHGAYFVFANDQFFKYKREKNYGSNIEAWSSLSPSVRISGGEITYDNFLRAGAIQNYIKKVYEDWEKSKQSESAKINSIRVGGTG